VLVVSGLVHSATLRKPKVQQTKWTRKSLRTGSPHSAEKTKWRTQGRNIHELEEGQFWEGTVSVLDDVAISSIEPPHAPETESQFTLTLSGPTFNYRIQQQNRTERHETIKLHELKAGCDHCLTEVTIHKTNGIFSYLPSCHLVHAPMVPQMST
jgi:hypothetical protein